MTRDLRITIVRRESQCVTHSHVWFLPRPGKRFLLRGNAPTGHRARGRWVATTFDFPRWKLSSSRASATRDHRTTLINSEETGRTMVRQANGEVETGNVDESSRYFSYLRTLADLTAIASIMAVQVIERLCFWFSKKKIDRDWNLDKFQSIFFCFFRDKRLSGHARIIQPTRL